MLIGLTQAEYNEIEAHMLERMKDSAHDRHHIYRVLWAGLDIAAHLEEPIDADVLLAACLPTTSEGTGSPQTWNSTTRKPAGKWPMSF